jgi:hypothetical protein
VHGDQHDNVIQRWSEDVKLQIEYSTDRRSMTVGSGDIWRAADRRLVKFGPMSDKTDMSYSARSGAFSWFEMYVLDIDHILQIRLWRLRRPPFVASANI